MKVLRHIVAHLWVSDTHLGRLLRLTLRYHFSSVRLALRPVLEFFPLRLLHGFLLLAPCRECLRLFLLFTNRLFRVGFMPPSDVFQEFKGGKVWLKVIHYVIGGIHASNIASLECSFYSFVQDESYSFVFGRLCFVGRHFRNGPLTTFGR